MDSGLNRVRKLELGLSISLALHGAGIAWVGIADPFPERRELPPATTTIEVIAKAPEPEGVDVRLLDEATTRRIEASTPAPTPAPTPPAPTPRRRAATGRAAGSEVASSRGSGDATTPGEPTGPGEPSEKRSSYFDMRAGGRADLSLPTGRFDALDHAPAGTTPQRGVATSGLLEDSAGGRKKSDQDVFVAKVERDGSVTLRDAPNLSAELSPNPAKLLSGRFDINDYLMRRSKNDPYASRKLKFLDDTREERVAMGLAWRRQQLQQTAMIMRKNLERAWAASADYAARKRALFELWDEIVEPDGSDEILAEASRAARKAVVGFIRARLPQGSEHAFTERELVAFNSVKQSRARFSPYE